MFKIGKRSYIIVIFILLLMIIGCDYNVKKDGLYAVLTTNLGNIVCELYYDKAPVTVGNFIGLAEGKIEYKDPKTEKKIKGFYYDGLIFHRIIKDFIIQSGDILGNGTGGPGYSFVDEFDGSLKHDSPGILSMANSGPNSNGSQFFITLNSTPYLDGKHSVFGKVIIGMDVVNKIGNVKVDKDDKPYEDVFIKKVKIIRKGDKAKKFDAIASFALKDEKLKKMLEEKAKKLKILMDSIGVEDSKLITTETGLKYFILKHGYGTEPKNGNIILADYIAYFEDGEIFGDSYKTKEPIEYKIGDQKMILGLIETFYTMKRGEKRVVIIPYYLGFGKMGNPPVIPAEANLIFVLEIKNIK